MAFRSDYPDLSEAACAQIGTLFPRGSQSQGSDGSLPLERIAALGYRGLRQNIRQAPTEIRRIAGEMDSVSGADRSPEDLAADICSWLTKRGVQADGWPLPLPRHTPVNPFSILGERGKARSLFQVISDGRRLLLDHEKQWLLGVLKRLMAD